jgi:hypothetical protein
LTEPRWLSGRQEVGKHLGVSGRQASKLRTQYRDFPAKIIDGRLTANTADLDAWMRKREHTCSVCGKTVQNETFTFALPHPPN